MTVNLILINWLNPKKLQAITINKQDRSNHNCCLTIKNAEIKSKESVTLLGIEIDNKLNFRKYVSAICKKANNQLNAIGRIGAVLWQMEKEILEILINSFAYSSFKCELFVWHLITRKWIEKVENVQEGSLKFILNH